MRELLESDSNYAIPYNSTESPNRVLNHGTMGLQFCRVVFMCCTSQNPTVFASNEMVSRGITGLQAEALLSSRKPKGAEKIQEVAYSAGRVSLP